MEPGSNGLVFHRSSHFIVDKAPSSLGCVRVDIKYSKAETSIWFPNRESEGKDQKKKRD